MSTPKRQKLSDDGESARDENEDTGSERFDHVEGLASDSSSSSEQDSFDTDGEIANAKITKSKKTLKRKRRATEPSRFGATLQFLLDTDAPSTQPLSLKPSVARKRNDEKLELKARKVLQIEKKEKEDKCRVVDVIGGWGGESERALRKVAQRGGKSPMFLLCNMSDRTAVVKLFNAIQQSRTTVSVATQEPRASRGSGKPSLPSLSLDKGLKGERKGKNKDNEIGRGKLERSQ